jgi:hypothetical protein
MLAVMASVGSLDASTADANPTVTSAVRTAVNSTGDLITVHASTSASFLQSSNLAPSQGGSNDAKLSLVVSAAVDETYEEVPPDSENGGVKLLSWKPSVTVTGQLDSTCTPSTDPQRPSACDIGYYGPGYRNFTCSATAVNPSQFSSPGGDAVNASFPLVADFQEDPYDAVALVPASSLPYTGLFEWSGDSNCMRLNDNEDGGKLLDESSLGTTPFGCSRSQPEVDETSPGTKSYPSCSNSATVPVSNDGLGDSGTKTDDWKMALSITACSGGGGCCSAPTVLTALDRATGEQATARLNLMNALPGTPRILSKNKPTTIEVGQALSLYPVCPLGRPSASGPWKWHVTGYSSDGGDFTSALKSYYPGRDKAQIESLTYDDLYPASPKGLFLFFVKPGLQRVSVDTANGTAAADFKVLAPAVSADKPETCPVALDTKYPRQTPLPILGPGLNDSCPGTPGIKFGFSVTPQVAGEIGVIQVVDDQVNLTTMQGVDTYDEFPLPFYAMKGGPQTFPAPMGKATSWKGQDSPGTSLSGEGERPELFSGRLSHVPPRREPGLLLGDHRESPLGVGGDGDERIRARERLEDQPEDGAKNHVQLVPEYVRTGLHKARPGG